MKKVLPILLIGLLVSQALEILEYFLMDPAIATNGSDFTKNDTIGLVILALVLILFIGVAYYLANHIGLGTTILLLILLTLVDTLISENLTSRIAHSLGLPKEEKVFENAFIEYLVMAGLALVLALIGYGINRMRKGRKQQVTIV